MKTSAKEEQFLTDANGRRTGIVLDLETYAQLREAAEKLADIHAYDALRDQAHSEIASGQFATLTTFRTNRACKKKAWKTIPPISSTLKALRQIRRHSAATPSELSSFCWRNPA